MKEFESSSLFSCYYRTESIVLPGTKEDAWAVVTDFGSYDKWNTVCLIELCGEFKVGTDIKIRVTYPGLELESHECISLIEELNKVGWAYRGMPARWGLVKTQRNVVFEVDEKTKQVYVYGEIIFTGVLAGFGWWVKGNGVKNLLRQFNKDLVKYLDKPSKASDI